MCVCVCVCVTFTAVFIHPLSLIHSDSWNIAVYTQKVCQQTHCQLSSSPSHTHIQACKQAVTWRSFLHILIISRSHSLIQSTRRSTGGLQLSRTGLPSTWHQGVRTFGVLFDRDCNDCDVRERAGKLCSTYPTDLDGSLSDKLIQIKHFVQNETLPVQLLQALERHGIKTTFPNVYVALKLFLTLPVSNCEGERLFSVLKQVNNELRTTMSQTRLSALSLLAIEHELVSALDFKYIVHQFAHSKCKMFLPNEIKHFKFKHALPHYLGLKLCILPYYVAFFFTRLIERN